MAIKKSSQRLAAVGFGILFVSLLLIIALAVPNPTPFQYTVFRIVLALAAGGVAAMIPGFISVEVGSGVRAGGAMAVFIVVYFFSPAKLLVDNKEPTHKADSDLALVDIALADNPNENSGFPLLDIKLRNRGNVAAFLRAQLEVLDRVQYTDCAIFDAQPISWTYQANLDESKPIALSQTVPAHEVDRFAFVVGHNLRGPDQHAFYKLRLIIEYDEDNKRIVSDPFTLYLPGMAIRFAASSGHDPECYERLRKVLEPVHAWPVEYSLPNYFKE